MSRITETDYAALVRDLIAGGLSTNDNAGRTGLSPGSISRLSRGLQTPGYHSACALLELQDRVAPRAPPVVDFKQGESITKGVRAFISPPRWGR